MIGHRLPHEREVLAWDSGIHSHLSEITTIQQICFYLLTSEMPGPWFAFHQHFEGRQKSPRLKRSTLAQKVGWQNRGLRRSADVQQILDKLKTRMVSFLGFAHVCNSYITNLHEVNATRFQVHQDDAPRLEALWTWRRGHQEPLAEWHRVTLPPMLVRMFWGLQMLFVLKPAPRLPT